ncbi:MAG: hypothetical protein AAB131_10230 [Actinomycetota bacterium]
MTEPYTITASMLESDRTFVHAPAGDVMFPTLAEARRYAATPLLIEACRQVVAARIWAEDVAEDAMDAIEQCIAALRAAGETA